MFTYALEFYPPMEGLDGTFSTFRLGRKWVQKLRQGDEVMLFDKKQSAIIGRARVVNLYSGKLLDMAFEHAGTNHNQKAFPGDDAEKAERLLANMTRRFGPKALEGKRIATVIYLERFE
jgi:hypothetical protein